MICPRSGTLTCQLARHLREEERRNDEHQGGDEGAEAQREQRPPLGRHGQAWHRQRWQHVVDAGVDTWHRHDCDLSVHSASAFLPQALHQLQTASGLRAQAVTNGIIMKGKPVWATSARQRMARLSGSRISAVTIPYCSSTGSRLRSDAAAHS